MRVHVDHARHQDGVAVIQDRVARLKRRTVGDRRDLAAAYGQRRGAHFTIRKNDAAAGDDKRVRVVQKAAFRIGAVQDAKALVQLVEVVAERDGVAHGRQALVQDAKGDQVGEHEPDGDELVHLFCFALGCRPQRYKHTHGARAHQIGAAFSHVCVVCWPLCATLKRRRARWQSLHVQ